MTHPLVSLGYEGRDVRGLVEQLQHEGVAVLVDVRLTPLSRKVGMSKRRLAQSLAEAGIAYTHLPALGNPRDNRAPFRTGDPGSIDRYQQIIHDSAGRSALSQVAELLADGPVALLCFERDHETCHRRIVTSELQSTTPDLKIVRL